MNLAAILRIAMRALARNKLRSALTMLGIIIGVGAVIAMVSVGQGAQQQAQDQIAAMGSNILFVGSGTVTRGGMRMGWGATKTLVVDEMVRKLERSISTKVPLRVKQGFDPATVTDPLYFNDPLAQVFVPLDAALYARIESGEIRL